MNYDKYTDADIIIKFINTIIYWSSQNKPLADMVDIGLSRIWYVGEPPWRQAQYQILDRPISFEIGGKQAEIWYLVSHAVVSQKSNWDQFKPNFILFVK